MQTPASSPASTSVLDASSWQGLPYWVQLIIGFLLIGLGASIAASQLRAAIPPPEDPKKKALHHLYAPSFGLLFGLCAPFALPGFGVDSRWLIGLVAPFLWAPLYSIVKERYEKQLGVKLPDAKTLTQGSGTSPTPPTGGTS